MSNVLLGLNKFYAPNPYYGGFYKVTGQVTTVDIPHFVRLYHRYTGLLVAGTYTDSSGNFQLLYLDGTKQYYITCSDSGYETLATWDNPTLVHM